MEDVQGPIPTLVDEDTDLPDEAPDFRFLYSSTSPSHHAIPRRGDKDFEPHGTITQQSTLNASLEAMIETLSGLRIHLPKAHLSAKHDALSGRSIVENPKGPHFRSAGRAGQSGAESLLQEESLFLLERGNLDQKASESDPNSDHMPYSLQQTYSTLTEIPLDTYLVYSALKRSGYIVMRASELSNIPHAAELKTPILRHLRLSLTSTFDHLLKSWVHRDEPPGALLKPGLFRSIADVQRLLSIVPYHDARQDTYIPPVLQTGRATADHDHVTPPIANSSLLRIMFHVWKPGHVGYKKSAPGKPDFQIAVLSTNESSAPKFWELDRLIGETSPPESMSPGSNKPKGHVYSRLRNRERSALIAVVDQGVISYVRFTDAQFGRERLYAKVERGGGKGKGRATKPKTRPQR